MTVVHYVNQFFAGLGSEDAAMHEPVRLEGPQGPGRGLGAAGLDVDVTLACGDDHFAVTEDAALATLVGWLKESQPDVLVCGPAFDAGRYGYACGSLAREASRLGIPVVAGMHEENPGVQAAEGGAYIVPTSATVAGMKEALPTMAALALRLAIGEELGEPEEEGYLPRGIRRNAVDDRSGADRAVDMLMAKVRGEPFETEAAPSADRVPPAKPVPDLSTALIALVSESGCVPIGNPDGLVSRRAHSWYRYPLEGMRSLAGVYETVHGGFDKTAANEDANRLVPLDVVRTLEDEGRIGVLHETFRVTTGVDTPVASATRIGQEMAAELVEAGVQAAIVTGTCGTGSRSGAILAREIERAGIPATVITALPSIGQMIGANRIVRGTAITNPVGDPSLSHEDEVALRRRLVETALDLVATEVDPGTVRELDA
ncbi:MAG: glycine/betaine/sarcosine/D-proline family reductase selenoprotein B [Actinomycetota bacterium]